jgi:prefoldin subunit 5
MEAWTDERLDDLAESLRPLPGEVAALRVEMGAVRADLRRFGETQDRLAQDLSALQRQIAQIGWGLSAALVGVLVTLIVTGL